MALRAVIRRDARHLSHWREDDLTNAGGIYEDREVVRDGNLITSRMPDDLPAFCHTIIETMAEAKVAASASTR
jgi:protease I